MQQPEILAILPLPTRWAVSRLQALPGDRGFQNFDVQGKKFSNIVRVWGGKVTIEADVGYDVRPEEPSK